MEFSMSVDQLPDLNLNLTVVTTSSGPTVSATTQTADRVPSDHRKTTATISSVDSVLGSPDLSTDTSEQDWDEVAPRQRQQGVAVRLRSLQVQSDSSGLASAYFAERPKSSGVDTEESTDDFLTTEIATSTTHPLEAGFGKTSLERGARQTTETAEDVTPVNSLRRNQTAVVDHGSDITQDRFQPSPLAGSVSSPSSAAGSDVVERSRRTRERRRSPEFDNQVVQPSYQEAALHKELLRNDLTDADRQQIKNSLARKLYHKSMMMYASERGGEEMSYSYTLFAANLNSLHSRRHDISKSFFQDICDPSFLIHHLLPPPLDTSVLSRLRLRTVTPLPRLSPALKSIAPLLYTH